MTNQQILEKAIQKAIDGGWNKASNIEKVEYKDSMGVVVFSYYDSNVVGAYDPYRIIFNHDFAKALWPGNILLDEGGVKIVTKEPLWRHHLMMMVVDPDPLVYLSQHI